MKPQGSVSPGGTASQPARAATVFAGGKQPCRNKPFLFATLATLIGLAGSIYAVTAGKGTPTGAGPIKLLVPAAQSQPPAAQPTALAPPASSTAGVATTNSSGPQIQFASPVYDFGKVNGGALVKCSFVFTNAGSSVLEVSNVLTTCGCTTAGEWTRQVQPGQTGSIPIEFNSANFSGQVGKSVTVMCNDPKQPMVELQIKATIWRPIELIPQLAVLNVNAESPSNTTTVVIANRLEEPLTLSVPEINNPAFAVELRTNQPGKEFQLIVRTVPPLPTGTVQGMITMKTSSTNMPTLSLYALANMQPVVMVMPPRINLPAPPLSGQIPVTIAIRNNGTNLLTLSEPVVNAEGVGVQMREYEPGRSFALTLTFPAGFEIAKDQQVELSAKTSHPQFPVIKMPIFQVGRPAPAVIPASVTPPGTNKPTVSAAPSPASTTSVTPNPPATPTTPVVSVAGAATTNGSGSKIQFATPVYDFGKVNGGELVKHAFVFTNVGSTELVISNVQTTCGCTTAGDWTRQVQPGQTGSIPIQFSSGNFTGPIEKAVTVTCNDTKQPVVELKIKGTVWRPIEVTPQLALLNVTAESPSNATTVFIVNKLEQPLRVWAPESGNPAFSAELRTNQPGKEFQLIVKTVPPLPAGNVQGLVTLKTSSTNMPTITVNAWANVQPVIMVMPAQITLPAAPLANPMNTTVSIRNNGTNTLALSEPVVKAQGAGVQLKEHEPGRFFIVTVTFPAGFEIAKDQSVELNVKSSHPQFPVIKVPVLQPPRQAPSMGSPATTAAPPPGAH